jgi:hypothetical protein
MRIRLLAKAQSTDITDRGRHAARQYTCEFSSDGNTEIQVTLFNRHELTDNIASVLGSVRKKGVKLWVENNQLRYEAPRGALTQEDIEGLKLSRDQIVARLKKTTGTETSEPMLEPSRRIKRVPLAFSQLAHWHLHQLDERHAIRQVASATRLHGRINVKALRRGIAEVVRQHDALRTRIVVIDGIPMQEVAESVACELELCDLTGFSEGLRETEIQRLIESYILQPIDVAVDLLVGVRLLRIRDDEHVLIMAMEHMISDMFSMNILLRGVFAAYMHTLKDRDWSLPEIPFQFADYAVQQRNTHASWAKKHGTYWNDFLSGCQRLRFPNDKISPTTTEAGWGIVSVSIGIELKKELRLCCAGVTHQKL